jgi:hypothetical protein
MKKWFIAIFLLLLAGSALAQSGLSDEDIERLSQSVVLIGAMQNGEIVASGSGTIVTAQGLIYTNRHVVEGADDYAIFLLEDMNEQPVLTYYAGLVAMFEEADFAILQIDRNAQGNVVIPTTLRLPFIETAEVEDASRNDTVYVFGYPGIGDGFLVVTEGKITTVQNGDIGNQRMVVWYQTDAEIAPGNSGGLAVNENGEILGIPTLVQGEDRTGGRLGGILPFGAVLALSESGTAVTTANTPGLGGSGGLGGNNNNNTTAEMSIEITDVEFNAENNGENGLIIHTRILATGYKGVQLRAGVFFYWDDGTSVMAAEDATDYRSPSGFLTSQEVIVPEFDATEWADFKFWVPNAALPTGLTGTREGVILAEMGVDGEAFTASSNEFPFTFNYGDTPAVAQGETFTCEGVTVNNGVEIIINMRPNFTYTATAIGIGSFDPVIGVWFTENPAESLCNDDTTDATRVRVNLPDTGLVAGNNVSAQMPFSHSSSDLANISVVVGEARGNGGEFVLVLEGMAATEADGPGDPFTVDMNSPLIAGGRLDVFMIGAESQLDPQILLVNVVDGKYEIWKDGDGNEIYCDNAGTQFCWSDGVTLDGGVVTNANRRDIFADENDAALRLGIESLDPQLMNFLMTSYKQTRGQYILVFRFKLG